MELNRCIWVIDNPLYIKYHDEEWGLPIRNDDKRLFEALVIEQMKVGLSRLFILQKRDDLRRAFVHFEAAKVAKYTEEDEARLMLDQSIVRNRPKIEAVIYNARAISGIQREYGSFDTFIWQFVGGKPIQNSWTEFSDVPSVSAESVAMSKGLIKRGFKRVNPAICYAFMQAVGMVNDHLTDCFRYAEVSESQ